MRNSSPGYPQVGIIRTTFLMLFFVVFSFVLASGVSISNNDLFNIEEVNMSIQVAPEEIFVQIMGMENVYIGQFLHKEEKSLSISKSIFQTITQINFGDIRSLIGNELPGYASYDSKILVHGEGTDFTTLPIESAPPMEVLLQEREMAQQELDELNKDTKSPPIHAATNKKIFIYHSHSWESYLPLLGLTGDSNASKAVDSKTNITIVGDLLSKELEQYNIGVTLDQTNIAQELKKNGWGTGKSYDVSRNIVESAVVSNGELEYFLDIHRDSQRKELTTATINNTPYARLFFVVGEGHPNYEKNLGFANKLHEALEQTYPGISRGIIEKGTDVGNGVYNQDISSNSIVVEVGGVDNNMEELKNTVEALAQVISDYYWNAEKVTADE